MRSQATEGCRDDFAEEESMTSLLPVPGHNTLCALEDDQDESLDVFSFKSINLHNIETLPKWEEIEDRIVILLLNNQELVRLFQATHSILLRHNIRDAQSLVLHFATLYCQLQQEGMAVELSQQQLDRTMILEQVASYFVNFKIRFVARLSLTRLLLSVLLQSENESSLDVLNEETLIACLSFLSDASVLNVPSTISENRTLHFDSIALLWELRAMCIRIQLKQQLLEESCRQIERGGTVVAELISCSACLIASGIGKTTHVVKETVQAGGDLMKDFLVADIDLPECDKMDPRTRLVLCIYADSARRLSATAHGSAKKLVANVRDASSHGIGLVLERWQEHDIAEHLVPNPRHRAILAAAGHVGIASIGAVAVVGEALIESTTAITQTTLAVTADVVQHKYGASAGHVLRDSSDTALHVVGTIAQTKKLAMAGTAITKAVAKKAGKEHVLRNLSDADESSGQSPISVMQQSEDDSTVISVASFPQECCLDKKRIFLEDMTEETEEESGSEGEYLGTIFEDTYSDAQKSDTFATLPEKVIIYSRSLATESFS